MGNSIQKKLIVVILLLGVTSALAHVRGDTEAVRANKKPLRDAFTDLDGYRVSGQLQVEQNIFDFLKLDDYAYANFRKGKNSLSLYIGYYYTEDKVTAAHSPLVCFPAQGWMLDKPLFRQVSTQGHSVNYAEMEATLGKQKQLILYWFQTYLRSTPHTHMQKIYALYNRIMHNQEQSAFVRIAIPLDNLNREEAERFGTDFIRIFYPRFIDYIENNG
ncbi:EpsI family protein [Desulfosarcina ovata subsp. sediminis]|uniref:EpsI family protein n=1 Tax=Desulfosarcina ovata subsp. sediminis TaxID=885957 RepID=A0A5K7ZJW0_9BACT|nr:exosortase C-terminal domain/associated protein EpsI [Desulfosarcina ovata]BBO81316.1 EpsI family protein [Desulfosarcina ovata subsp. sediminis]